MNFVNNAFNKGVFPDSLQIVDITPAHKKDGKLQTSECISFIIKRL